MRTKGGRCCGVVSIGDGMFELACFLCDLIFVKWGIKDLRRGIACLLVF